MPNRKRIHLLAGGFVASSFLFLLFQNFTSARKITAPECSGEKMAEILATPTNKKNSQVNVNCSFSLSGSEVIKKSLLIDTSGVRINCNGASVDTSVINSSHSILIASKATKDTMVWIPTTNVSLSNCKIIGSLRTMGMAKNGEGALLRDSSRLDANHTKRAQSNAPSDITLDKLSIKTTNAIPLYIGPGSTKVRLKNSNISGNSESVGIYMDAESGFNEVTNNKFNFSSSEREVIAMDGSANNIISGNTFKTLNNGGIFIYRNCGEGGTIRHQRPAGNVISNNSFEHQSFESINVGSRKGNSPYCAFDSGYLFGSSVDDNDFADNTIIKENIFTLNPLKREFFSRFIIVSNSKSTAISNNKIISESDVKLEFSKRVAGAFVDGSGNIVEEK